MNFKEVLLVVNPIAGDIDKKEIVAKVKEQLQYHNINFHLYSTTGENDKEKIKSAISEHDIERVLVAGGDGTINLVADTVKDLNIILGIIPAGSANGLALNLETPNDLDNQIKIALGDNIKNLDLLCLNDIICLHISDLGINAELIQNYEQSSLRGKMGYLIQTIPTLIQSKFPFKFLIETDNYSKEEEAILVGIANMKKYGTGAIVNPNGIPDDGIFEILIFKKLDIPEILKTLSNEADLDPDFVQIIPAKKARITCKNPVSFQIDGEYIGKETSVEIKILAEKLKIASP